MLGGALVLAGTLGLAWWMARRLHNSVEALGAAVRATGHNARLRLPPPAFLERGSSACRSPTRTRAGGRARGTRAQRNPHADHPGHGDGRHRHRRRERHRAVQRGGGGHVRPVRDLRAGPAHRSARAHAGARRPRGAAAAGHPGRRARHGLGPIVEDLRSDGSTFHVQASISVADEGEGRLYTAILRKVADAQPIRLSAPLQIRRTAASTTAGRPCRGSASRATAWASRRRRPAGSRLTRSAWACRRCRSASSRTRSGSGAQHRGDERLAPLRRLRGGSRRSHARGLLRRRAKRSRHVHRRQLPLRQPGPGSVASQGRGVGPCALGQQPGGALVQRRVAGADARPARVVPAQLRLGVGRRGGERTGGALRHVAGRQQRHFGIADASVSRRFPGHREVGGRPRVSGLRQCAQAVLAIGRAAGLQQGLEGR